MRREDGFVLLTGETYPVKDALKKLGAVYDKRSGGWWIHEKLEKKAQHLIDNPHFYGNQEEVDN